MDQTTIEISIRNVIVYKWPQFYQKNLVDFITAVPNGSF